MPLTIIRSDITTVKADAVVNSANPDPLLSQSVDLAGYRDAVYKHRASVDHAMLRSAGAELLMKAGRKIGRLSPGEAAVTKPFHLPAKYIIHKSVGSPEST